MTQAHRPAFPTIASSREAAQRIATELNRLVNTLLDAAVFLTRQTLGQVIIAPQVAGKPLPSLKWGEMNRVVCTANASVQLPPIQPRHVGEPLYIAKLSGANALTLLPSGTDLNGTRAPLINDAASFTFGAAGLNVLMTDGLNWSVTT